MVYKLKDPLEPLKIYSKEIWKSGWAVHFTARPSLVATSKYRHYDVAAIEVINNIQKPIVKASLSVVKSAIEF